ncbi:F-box protein At4g18380-like [Rutidosis leptorrhynchoides]|uniref:F-box protein At4g18380-like n=1 Tax=Rutidosis leptorrhynchoides TaxID=125765 RepID=UPI003A9A61F9
MNINSNPQQQFDHFTKLPDDLLIFILTKITQQDFKFLFRCSLVSKLFASSIPLMPRVSISISPPNTRKPGSDYSKSRLQDVADRFIDRKMEYLTSLRPQIQKALTFLKKFHHVQSLDVVFTTDDDHEFKEDGFRYGFLPSLINWKTKFDFKLQSFVFLFAKYVNRKTEETEETGEVDEVTPEELELRLYSSFHGVVDSIEWGNVMSCLLVQHPMLREITISGSRKGGKIFLKNEEIVDLRNSLSPEDITRISENGNGIGVTINVKSAYVPILYLPLSGFVMKGVSLVVVRVGRRLYQPGDDGFRSGTDSFSDSDSDNETDDDHEDNRIEYDDNDIINWDYDSEEEVFREAVTSILVHHKDKMHRET